MGNQCRLRSASDICPYFLIPVISRAAEFIVLCNLSKSERVAPYRQRRNNSSLDLWLRKTQSGKSHYHRDVIILEKLRFQNVLRRRSSSFQIPPV